MKMSHKRE